MSKLVVSMEIERVEESGERYPDKTTLAKFAVEAHEVRAFEVYQAALASLTAPTIEVSEARP